MAPSLRKSTRLFRWRARSLFSDRAAFRLRMLTEEPDWLADGYTYTDLCNDAWVIRATGSIYLAVSKSANTTMKTLIAEEVPSAKFLAQLKLHTPAELASDDTLIHFYTPAGMARLRDCKLTPGDLANCRKRCFTVVRNPIHRFASAYIDKIASTRITPLKETMWTFRECETGTEISIDDLIAYIAETPTQRIEKHVRPQWSCCGAGRIPITMVGKVESLYNDVQAFAERELITAESARRLTVRNATYRSMDLELSARQKRALTELYAGDFEAFDY